MKKKINAKLFIIPNHPYTKQELGWFDMKDWENWANRTQSLLDNFEGNLTVEEPMIQVWATNNECDNFTDHMWQYAEMIGILLSQEESEEDYKKIREERFPSHLPYSLLKGLKEGETLTLRRKDGVEFEFELSQMTTRYAFGNFEEVLEKLV